MYSQPRGRLLASSLTQATVSGFNDRVIVSGKPDYLSFTLPAGYFANFTIIPKDMEIDEILFVSFKFS